MAGSINEEMKTFVETWESVSPVQNFIVRLNTRGDEEHFGVAGSRKFKITTYERIITQDKIVDPKNDPFTNGCFRPLVVPHEVNVETNPNALSDDDIDAVFKSSDVAWDAYMEVIDSPATLQRMLDRAESDDIDISMKRYRQIQRKMDDTGSQVKRIVQRDQEEYEKMGATGGGAETIKGARPSRGKSAGR